MIRLCGGRQNLQWTGHFLQYIRGHLGIEAGRLQFAMAEQYLDQSDIDLLFQLVSCKRMSEQVHRDSLVDLGIGCGSTNGAG